MLDFEEEVARFQPSLEVGDVETQIVKEDLTDMTDLMMDLLKNRNEKPADRQCLLQHWPGKSKEPGSVRSGDCAEEESPV